jgi:uncharacterized protein YaaN involved in tellurite resistance
MVPKQQRYETDGDYLRRLEEEIDRLEHRIADLLSQKAVLQANIEEFFNYYIVGE